MGVTVIIPVKNEAQHLRACLDSVIDWTDRVFVVDSGSDDDTEAITKSYAQRGVRHVLHAYEGPADQKNWALDSLSITSSWVQAPETALDRSEITSAVHSALCGVPEPYRTAFILREEEGMSYEEIAIVVGSSPKTVSPRLYRARKLLREALGGRPGFEEWGAAQ